MQIDSGWLVEAGNIFCFRKRNFIDRLIDGLEQHSIILEDKVTERTDQYRAEKDRADNLLYQMLPQPVADKLKAGQVRWISREIT